MRQQGRRVDCGAFILAWRSRPATPDLPSTARLGVVASRASVGDAVHRNRAKRRLRELFRKHQLLVPAGVDVVLTARAPVLALGFTELEAKFVAACRRIGGASRDA